MLIDKSQYLGYIWQSDQTAPEVLPSEGIIDTDHPANPFIIEAHLTDGEKSISIKFADGHCIVNEYNLSECENAEPVSYIPNRMDGVSILKFKRVWTRQRDTLCEEMETLTPAQLIFVGLEKNKTE